MRKVFSRMAVGVATIGLAATFGLTALAQQGPAQMGPGGGRGQGPWARGMALGFALGQLDLTAAQRDQVRGILAQHREETQGLRDQALEARRALDQAIQALPVDEGAIRSASAALGEVRTQQALARARVRSEVWNVLTPEQRAKAETMRAQMRERMNQRMKAGHHRPMSE
jgi:periplasmic protein CpxP/Spy